MKAYSHGGDVYTVPVRLDFSVNVHPDGMPDEVREAVIRSADRWGQYPDERLRALRTAFTGAAAQYGVPFKEDEIIFGDGSAELMYLAARRYEGKKAAVVTPCFTEYRRALEAAGAFVKAFHVPAEEPLSLRTADAVRAFLLEEQPAALMLGNPVNPTGRAFRKEEVLSIAETCASTGTDIILDECFVWFTEDPLRHTVFKEMFLAPERFRHVLVINAFTKIFAMPGLRFGFGLSPDAERLGRLEALRQPWPVSVPAEAAALCCAKRLAEGRGIFQERKAEPVLEGADRQTGCMEGTADLRAERELLSDGLRRLGLHVVPSEVNYILFRAGNGTESREQRETGRDLRAACLKEGILIRSCADFEGLGPGWYRAAVRRRHENEELLRVLGEILHGKEHHG